MIFCLQRKCNPGWSNRRLLRQDALMSGRDENSLPALCSPRVSLCAFVPSEAMGTLCARPSQKQCLICHDALGGENLERARIWKQPFAFPLQMAYLLQSFRGSSRKHPVPLSVFFLTTEMSRTWSQIRHSVLGSLSSAEGPRCFQRQRREAFSCIKADATLGLGILPLSPYLI